VGVQEGGEERGRDLGGGEKGGAGGESFRRCEVGLSDRQCVAETRTALLAVRRLQDCVEALLGRVVVTGVIA
jgi:hypothetical protein